MTKICIECGKPFEATRQRQKYHKECAYEVKKRQVKKYQARLRIKLNKSPAAANYSFSDTYKLMEKLDAEMLKIKNEFFQAKDLITGNKFRKGKVTEDEREFNRFNTPMILGYNYDQVSWGRK